MQSKNSPHERGGGPNPWRTYDSLPDVSRVKSSNVPALGGPDDYETDSNGMDYQGTHDRSGNSE